MFSRMKVNGNISEHWEYVRNVTTNWAYNPSGYVRQWVPYYDIYDDNIRCGRGAAISGPGVKLLTVPAGDDVVFVVGMADGSSEDNKAIYHEGPMQAYLSRVPDDQAIEEYQGDGDWFKIDYLGPKDQTTWTVLGTREVPFKIPETTPPGKYLIRAEQVFPFNSDFNATQFYVNCAHLDIVGPGGGIPVPTVKFPGAYDLFDRNAFPWLIVNGTLSDRFQYIREVLPLDGTRLVNPQERLGSLNETCGRGAWQFGPSTQTATVLAGTEVGFRLGEKGGYEYLFHEGPATLYASRVPENVDIEDYAGHEDGAEWFKIGYMGPADDKTWSSYGLRELNFTIPEAIPAGKYLLRMEHLFLMVDDGTGYIQLFVNCAQVDIVGSGAGVPVPSLKFPGSYVVGETVGTTVTEEQKGIYDPATKQVIVTGLLDYVAPGGPVWLG
ncbi:unnamed protein product [Clonostachys byssicola]|uniref:lytic cellulose monooxygenase (C4-dehydrogenating) n=1 Tax=Clonostachys byssicola TaxID=160290 RepID=A0A9N9UN94_9HYPO|nr:unnamed protein product [Clonostachys byssicola]